MIIGIVLLKALGTRHLNEHRRWRGLPNIFQKLLSKYHKGSNIQRLVFRSVRHGGGCPRSRVPKTLSSA